MCSAVGVLPLALQYGWDVVAQFLEGANAMDDHFLVRCACGVCVRVCLCVRNSCMWSSQPRPLPATPRPPTHTHTHTHLPQSAPLGSNLPVLMGLTSVWNISFLGLPARALLPYCPVRARGCVLQRWGWAGGAGGDEEGWGGRALLLVPRGSRAWRGESPGHTRAVAQHLVHHPNVRLLSTLCATRLQMYSRQATQEAAICETAKGVGGGGGGWGGGG